MLYLLLLVLSVTCGVRAATADEWRSRSIYQVMTDRYALKNDSTTTPCDPAAEINCGGSWQGIISNLDYIQKMGFDSIWISPVTAQIPQDTSSGSAYHGYWPNNMYELNNNFGSAADLQALSKAVHDRGMFLMVDVVVNQMAWAGDVPSIQYDQLIPFNNTSYYHPYCPITNNETVCWQGGGGIQLPDLRTEDTDVRSIFAVWISSLVAQYNIDGLRLDSAINVEVDFFTSFTKAAGVFCTGEVYSGITTDVCPYQETIGSILNYPIYFSIIRSLSSTSGSLVDLANELSAVQKSCNDTTVMGSFSENHDEPRFASYTSDISLAKNLLTYTVLTDGIPIIYEGQEQHYNGGNVPLNREAVWLSGFNASSPLYTYITALNVFRKQFSSAGDYLTFNTLAIYNATNTLALRKGNNGAQVITVINNDGASGQARNITLPSASTGFTAGDVVTEVVSCKNTTVDASGNLDITIQNGLPNVFYPAKLLVGSTICVNGTTTLPAAALESAASSSPTTSPTASRTGKSNPTSTSNPSTTSQKSDARSIYGGATVFLAFFSMVLLWVTKIC